ncbi:MAG: 2Fe-2S iron-sulfur cluster-binding protein [Acidobacteriota bacterium]
MTFAPLGLSAEAYPNETALDAARRAGAPLGNSCGGTGVCGRCRIQLVEGAEHLSAPTSLELCTAARRRFTEGERLACMAVVNGNCTVTTTYW